MNRNVSSVQEALDHYAARTFDLDELMETIGMEKAKYFEAIVMARAAIAKIDEKYKGELTVERANVTETKKELETLTIFAFNTGYFPDGKKRLPLENGAYVQVARRTTYKVVDPPEVIRWALDKGIEDTLIKSVTLDKDATKGAWSLFGKVRGVERKEKTTVSIKLPKEGKYAA